MSGRGGSMLLVVLATAASLLASAPVAVDVATVGVAAPPAAPPAAPVAAPPPPPAPSPEEIAARTVPVVVTIDASHGWTGVAGTGIIISPDGTVLTNHHVVSGATAISAVSPATGLTYDAVVTGYDRTRDVAVLQLGWASDLPVAALAESAPPVGTRVTAFGNADGGGAVVAAPGTVVALDRNVLVRDSADGSRHRLTGMLQTDAAIRPGDSGGPLVDEYGVVVGVNTAGAVDRDAAAADLRPEAYAIPIPEALAVLAQVESGVSDGSVHVGPTPRLGVSVTTSRSGEGSESREVGAEVLWVAYGTPAYYAGLEIGHVIVAFDRQPVTSTAELEDLLLHRSPGDTVHVEWWDETGRSRGADVTLDAGPAR